MAGFHMSKDPDLQDGQFADRTTRDIGHRDRATGAKSPSQSDIAAITHSAPGLYGQYDPQNASPVAGGHPPPGSHRSATAGPVFSYERYGGNRVAPAPPRPQPPPVPIPTIDNGTNTTAASTRQNEGSANGASYRRSNGHDRERMLHQAYLSHRSDRSTDSTQSLWYVCVIAALLAFVVGFFLGALLESSVMHLFDDSGNTIGTHNGGGAAVKADSATGETATAKRGESGVKGAGLVVPPQTGSVAKADSTSVDHSVPQPEPPTDAGSFDPDAPHCPFGHSMMGKIGSTQSRFDALPVRVANAYGCRDLCERIRTCMRAVYSAGERHTCYLELTDQVLCDIDQIKVSRACPPTNGSCVAWSKNCQCPHITNERLGSLDSALIVDTYLDHVANTIRCASGRSAGGAGVTSAKYFMDACSPRDRVPS